MTLMISLFILAAATSPAAALDEEEIVLSETIAQAGIIEQEDLEEFLEEDWLMFEPEE